MSEPTSAPTDTAADLDPARWFRIVDGNPSEPVDLDTMRRLVLDGTVRPDTYVWADGMPEWMAAARVPALVPPEQIAPPGWSEDPAAG